MQIFEVYTPDRERVGLIETYTSMQWHRRYHAVGEFVLHVPVNNRLAQQLRPEMLIAKGDEAGIIETIKFAYDGDTNGEMITAQGPMLSGYARRRILWGTISASAPQETVMTMLAAAMTQGERAIHGLTVAASQGRGEAVAYQETDIKLSDALTALSESSGIGFRVDFDPAALVFRTFEGVDRSDGQSANPRAIFSRGFENILSQTYGEDRAKHANVARVVYEKDDVVTAVTVGTATGRDRREIMIKASGLDRDEDGNDIPEAQRLELMRELGREKLAELAIIRSLDAQVNPAGNLLYKRDYDLGDIVSADAPEWGVRMDVRITEIKEIYEAAGTSLDITFGRGDMTFSEKVRWYANG